MGVRRILILAISFVMLMCGTAFADDTKITPIVVPWSGVISPASVNYGWKQDVTGWWYQRIDSSYPVNQWELIDGVWYCFNKDGYMLSDTYIFNMSEFRRKMAVGIGGYDIYAYYVTTDGSMLVNSCTSDGKWANESGEINLINEVIGKRESLMIDINKCYLIE